MLNIKLNITAAFKLLIAKCPWLFVKFFLKKLDQNNLWNFPPSYAVKAVMIEHDTSHGVNKLGSAMYVLF